MGYQQTSDERAKSGTSRPTGGDQPVGAATQRCMEMFGDDLVVGRIRNRLADAEDEAGSQKQSESVDQAGADRGGGPQEHARREKPIDLDVIQ